MLSFNTPINTDVLIVGGGIGGMCAASRRFAAAWTFWSRKRRIPAVQAPGPQATITSAATIPKPTAKISESS